MWASVHGHRSTGNWLRGGRAITVHAFSFFYRRFGFGRACLVITPPFLHLGIVWLGYHWEDGVDLELLFEKSHIFFPTVNS